MKEDEENRTCSMYGRNVYVILMGKLKVGELNIYM
jgi:hypothetical protein